MLNLIELQVSYRAILYIIDIFKKLPIICLSSSKKFNYIYIFFFLYNDI